MSSDMCASLELSVPTLETVGAWHGGTNYIAQSALKLWIFWSLYPKTGKNI